MVRVFYLVSHGGHPLTTEYASYREAALYAEILSGKTGILYHVRMRHRERGKEALAAD